MSKTLVRILLILASRRSPRRGDDIFRWWLTATAPTVESLGAHVEIADLRDLALVFGDEGEEPQTGRYVHGPTRRWAATVGEADAFVVVTPEYNHSLPGSLKDAFDLLGPEWGGKPIAWVGYGNTSAGTRALLAGKQVATTLGMVNVGPDVSLRLSEVDQPDTPRMRGLQEAAAVALSRLVEHALALGTLRRPRLEVASLPPGYAAHPGEPADADELLVLQRACWVDEALANARLDLPALHEDGEALTAALGRHDSIMIRHGGRLVASVQAWLDGQDWWIGRLMVAPDHRRRGLARVLLRHAEQRAPGEALNVRLHTGAASTTNLRLYTSEGFALAPGDDPRVAMLTKQRALIDC